MSSAAPAEQTTQSAVAPTFVFDCDHWLRAERLSADLAEVERDYLHDGFGIAELSRAPRTFLDCSPGVGALARRVALRSPAARIVCLSADLSRERVLRRNVADLRAAVLCSVPRAGENGPECSLPACLPQIGREFGLQTIDLVRWDAVERVESTIAALCRSPSVRRIVGRVAEPRLLQECVARNASSWRLQAMSPADGPPIYALARGGGGGDTDHARD